MLNPTKTFHITLSRSHALLAMLETAGYNNYPENSVSRVVYDELAAQLSAQSSAPAGEYTPLQTALLSGKFRTMDERDFDVFAGADENCIISEGNFSTVIVGHGAINVIDENGAESVFSLAQV